MKLPKFLTRKQKVEALRDVRDIRDIAVENGAPRRAVERLFKVTKSGTHALFKAGRGRIHMIGDQDYAHQILKDTQTFSKRDFVIRRLQKTIGSSMLTDEGPQWRPLHDQMASIFTPAAVNKAFAPIAAEEVELMIKRWLAEKKELDVDFEMRKLGIKIIGRTIFGMPLPEETVATIAEENTVLPVQKPTFWIKLMMVLGRQHRAHWAHIPTRQKKARENITAVLEDLIKQRRAWTEQPDDIMGRLLSAQVPNQASQSLLDKRVDRPGKVLEGTRSLTDREISEQIILFVLAGHETTAVSMTFAIQELLQNPEKLKTLQVEAAAVIGDRPVEGADYPKLGYAKAAFNETMRLHPPLHVLNRVARKETVGADGIKIKRRDSVAIDVLAMHKNAEYWTNPNDFEPQRFVDAKASRAFLPFGAGERVCIGRNMATLEGTLCLASIFNRLNITLMKAAEGESYSLSTRPVGQILISVEEKTHDAATPATLPADHPTAKTAIGGCPFNHS